MTSLSHSAGACRSARFRLPLALLFAGLLLFGVVSAAAGAGNEGPPKRDHERGHWFERSCSLPVPWFASCGVEVVADAAGKPLASTIPPAGAYGPTQFHDGYSLPLTSPTAQTIAIVDAYDHPSIEADLAVYSNYYGLPACTTANGCFRKVNEFGGSSYPTANSGWALEIALDVEVAHAICQNCKILLVEANSAYFSDLGTAENTAIALGASVVSNSWGAGEFSSETALDNSYFNHPGVPITVSSGDSGYGVEFPASSQYVTAVGGTTLILSADNSFQSESAWAGSGSGCSRYEPKPSWQHDNGCARRTVADVSADADPNTGAAVYDSFPYSGQSGWYQVGGTSLAAPLVAAVYALAGSPQNVVYGSAPYGNVSSLHDILIGSNGVCSPAYLCSGGPGFDGPTGFGTPNGVNAFAAAPAPPPAPDFSMVASPSSRTANQGAGVSYTVTLSSQNGFTDSVNLVVSGLPSGANGSFSPSSVNVVSPSSTFSVLTAASTPVGSYPLTITGTDAANPSLHHAAASTLVVQVVPVGNFSLSITPVTRTIWTPGTGTYALTITRQSGFTGAVTFSVSGLPSGVTGSFSPNPSSSSASTLTVSSTTRKRATVTITVTGTSGSLVHSVNATLRLR